MARLISVCRQNSDYVFERRQVPLEESGLTMVVQFEEKCKDCEGQIKQKELDRFIGKCEVLTKDELAVALLVTSKDIFAQLSQTVTCVGCRRSVERLFHELAKSGHPAVEPLVITKHSELSIKREQLFEPRALYCLFYIHGKSKKNKRCNLHSLDTHKVRTPSSWLDVWNLMSEECRSEVLIIDSSKLEDTLSSYLTKHRFCTECRSKVMLAFNILIGEHDSMSEKGYCPVLYDKLRCCPDDGHIHIASDSDYLALLIEKAEPELTGMNRRDRHAKTLDIAQEEVLTCLGIHIYERLYRIGQKLRAEEQTWELLFYLGVETLKRSFECAVEHKQGMSNLERMCEELLEEERAKEQRRELKRQKKKRRKANAKNERENLVQLQEQEANHCECSSISIATKPLQTSHLAQCDNHSSHVSSSVNCASEDSNSLGSSGESGCRNCDHGYGSEQDGCDNCSVPSSNDGSDICSEGICMHEGGECTLGDDLNYSECRSANGSPQRKLGTLNQQMSNHHCSRESPCHTKQVQAMSSLQDMLETAWSCEDEEEEGASGISEEDIRFFRANQSTLQRQRQELREVLRRRFNAMQQQRGASPGPSPDLSPSHSPQPHTRFTHM
ncbi:hypothetical protein BaRGS_00020525 [Batillaria attramentaria]|uniref:Gametogenetin-binding protein 2 n=1 Tax=Batillaria attramentaria TaxID=370345 RepID=A0ABD0KMU2_9CAEN